MPALKAEKQLAFLCKGPLRVMSMQVLLFSSKKAGTDTYGVTAFLMEITYELGGYLSQHVLMHRNPECIKPPLSMTIKVQQVQALLPILRLAEALLSTQPICSFIELQHFSSAWGPEQMRIAHGCTSSARRSTSPQGARQSSPTAVVFRCRGAVDATFCFWRSSASSRRVRIFALRTQLRVATRALPAPGGSRARLAGAQLLPPCRAGSHGNFLTSIKGKQASKKLRCVSILLCGAWHLEVV
ncbi:hypothetical protein Anapl_10715 [Anas platyrhynchos]|uniref:Uncharacterized protein n=1 Tax=Anas platyrhynchos TaxID=8839 RepID=R0LSZ0_ANAPL|nr:hypothetical protein Anapl_10715 [Anas platyrhynchos]